MISTRIFAELTNIEETSSHIYNAQNIEFDKMKLNENRFLFILEYGL